MKILKMTTLLPALIKYSNDAGCEKEIICYFDPISGDVADASLNKQLVALIKEYVLSKRISPIMPPIPSEGFTKLKPETYI